MSQLAHTCSTSGRVSGCTLFPTIQAPFGSSTFAELLSASFVSGDEDNSCSQELPSTPVSAPPPPSHHHHHQQQHEPPFPPPPPLDAFQDAPQQQQSPTPPPYLQLQHASASGAPAAVFVQGSPTHTAPASPLPSFQDTYSPRYRGTRTSGGADSVGGDSDHAPSPPPATTPPASSTSGLHLAFKMSETSAATTDPATPRPATAP
ncbi:hypothetical protein B566_EDAN013647, partial [Ephemera danica]